MNACVPTSLDHAGWPRSPSPSAVLPVTCQPLILLAATLLFGVVAPPSLAQPRATTSVEPETRVAEPRDERFQSVLNLPRYKQAHWGLLFVDLKSGETLYSLNGDQLFAPASVTKCFSTATALDAFGPDHRFETPVRRRGEVDAMGRLEGDLVLVASGDLTLGGRTTPDGRIAFTDNDHTYANGSRETQLTGPDPLAGLNELARQVAATGIRRVTGDVLIDDRLFDRAEGSGSGPGRVTPIIVNDNVIDFSITPTQAGKPALVEWRPQSASLQIETQFDTVPAAGRVITWIRELGPGRLFIHGQIPEGHAPVVRIHEVPDAASHARSLWIESLERHGVVVQASKLGENRRENLPGPAEVERLPVVARLVSPPLSENLRLILKVSHNLHASALPLLVATRHGKRSLADGMRVERDFLRRAGVDVETISFGGGAGGARADYVTPRATVQLLRHMATRPDFSAYRGALPVLGVDGTLAKSVDAESPARNRVFAKTGTLAWDNLLNDNSLLTSKALAGYLVMPDEREIAFAVFVNNVPLVEGLDSRAIGRDLGRICELMMTGGQ